MQLIDIHTTAILFIASKQYSGRIRVTIFIVLQFVKSFVWDWSVFTQYSYYCDFLCSRPESRLCDRHRNIWVRYIDTTKITVWCMASILIHMTYFSVYTIWISEHYRVIVSYSPTPSQKVSVILWKITINVWLQSQVHRVTCYFFKCMTFLYNKIQENITQSLFRRTGRAVLNHRLFQGTCRLSVNFHRTIILSSELHKISKGKFNILEIFILMFNFCFFNVEIFNTIFHT